MEDIAQRAGVSRRAVSKVLFPGNSQGIRVGEKTAERIRKIADEMGYLPNMSAKQLAGEKSRLIGVLVDSFGPSVVYDVMQQLERRMALHGYRLIIGQVHDDVNSIADYLRDFAGREVDGVVSLAHGYPQFEEQIHKLYDSFGSIQNMVCVGLPKIPGRDNIYVDVAKGIRMLVRHLYDTGHRRIALLSCTPAYESQQVRERGFREEIASLALDEKQCPVVYFERKLGTNPSPVSIEQCLDRLLQDHPDIDAIQGTNDLTAMYTIQYLVRHGIRVPEQIAVTGYDNMEFSLAANPPLTTIDQNTEELAEKVAGLLFSRMTEPERGEQILTVNPQLIVRESSRMRSF